MRIPLEELEENVFFSSEIDKYCIQSYKVNFQEEPHGDITKIDEKIIPNIIFWLAFLAKLFSRWTKKGISRHSWYSFLDIARILKHKKPDAFSTGKRKGFKRA